MSERLTLCTFHWYYPRKAGVNKWVFNILYIIHTHNCLIQVGMSKQHLLLGDIMMFECVNIVY